MPRAVEPLKNILPFLITSGDSGRAPFLPVFWPINQGVPYTTESVGGDSQTKLCIEVVHGTQGLHDKEVK